MVEVRFDTGEILSIRVDKHCEENKQKAIEIAKKRFYRTSTLCEDNWSGMRVYYFTGVDSEYYDVIKTLLDMYKEENVESTDKNIRSILSNAKDLGEIIANGCRGNKRMLASVLSSYCKL